MWIKFIILPIIFHKKSFWYYNWNCSQFERNHKFIFLLFFWINIADILNFKSARLKVHFVHFSKTLFTLKSLRNEIFSVNGGAGPVGPAQARTRLPPIHLKNSCRRDFNVKIVLEKCKERTLSWADLKFKMSPIFIQLKSRKINFWFCSNWEQFQL